MRSFSVISRLNRLGSHSLSPQGRCSRRLIILRGLLWTLTHSSLSFLYWGGQNWTPFSRCGEGLTLQHSRWAWQRDIPRSPRHPRPLPAGTKGASPSPSGQRRGWAPPPWGAPSAAPSREALPVPSPPLLAQGKGGATALREWPRVARPSRPSGGHARSAARPWQPAGPRHPRPFLAAAAAAPRPSAGKAALTGRCRAGWSRSWGSRGLCASRGHRGCWGSAGGGRPGPGGPRPARPGRSRWGAAAPQVRPRAGRRGRRPGIPPPPGGIGGCPSSPWSSSSRPSSPGAGAAAARGRPSRGRGSRSPVTWGRSRCLSLPPPREEAAAGTGGGTGRRAHPR